MALPERIQRMLDGGESLSPAWRWIGLQILEAEPGRTLLEMTVKEEMRNHQGVCHGGFLAMLADSAMGSALATVLPPGERHMSFDLKSTFMRPAPVGSVVRCAGHVVHSGRRTGVGEAELSIDGELIGTASASFIVWLPNSREG